MYKFLFKLGHNVLEIWKFFKGHSIFCIQVTVKGLFSKYTYSPAVKTSTLRHIYFSGVELFSTMTIAALILGMAIVGLISKALLSIDATPNIGSLLTTVIIRITGPFICGIFIILRTSTTLLVDIGMMKFNRELQTLETMNIDPYVYLYFPRILACIVSMVVLSIYFSFLSIIGGYMLLSYQLNTTLDYILFQVLATISFSDIATFVFKTVLIGFIAASIPIYTAKQLQKSQTALIKGMMSAMVGIFFTFIVIVILGEVLI